MVGIVGGVGNGGEKKIEGNGENRRGRGKRERLREGRRKEGKG